MHKLQRELFLRSQDFSDLELVLSRQINGQNDPDRLATASLELLQWCCHTREEGHFFSGDVVQRGYIVLRDRGVQLPALNESSICARRDTGPQVQDFDCLVGRHDCKVSKPSLKLFEVKNREAMLLF